MIQSDPRNDFLAAIKMAVESGELIRITFGKYRGDEDFEKVQARPVIIKESFHVSFTYSHRTKDEVKNFRGEDVPQEVERLIGAGFRCVSLFTPGEDLKLEFSKRMVPSLYRTKPSMKEPAVTGHNREKPRFVKEDRPWLKELGITTAEGKVRGEKYDKYRQIDKFIEIIDYLTGDIAQGSRFSALDFGSGKSYLTFALYDYLSFSRGLDASVKGIELREELVTLSNKAAGKCGLNGLSFDAGSIREAKSAPVDLLVALHACDTATDDALAFGLKNKARVIVVAPCCHKYLRPLLKLPERLQPVLGHGILEGRFSDSLTDGLRALFLEAFGYRTKVFEFISPEHTARNVMITAVRHKELMAPDKAVMEKIKKVLEEFSLPDFYLDTDKL